METEEPSRPARGLLLALGIVGILVGGLIAAELAVPLQPGLGGNPPPPPHQGGATVTMPPGVGTNIQLDFAPSNIVVVIGVNNTVTFDNIDTSPHTVTATDRGFDSGNMPGGAKWNYTFTSPGNFSYFCAYHAWMKGSVVVKPPSAGGATIVIPGGTGANLNLNYQPSSFTLVIGVNNTVSFRNDDSSLHTVSALDGSFESGNIQAGESWTHTFSVPGTYSYHCLYHSWMRGTIIVKTSA